MEAGTTTTNLTARLPFLNPADYDLWLMRIEQYFLMTDYSLWEDRRNEMKARNLLVVLPNKDQLEVPTHIRCKIANGSIEKRYIDTEPYLDSASTSQKSTNVAFVSKRITATTIQCGSYTAYGVSTAHTQSSPTSGDNLSDAVICAFLASQPNSPQMSRDDLEQIDPDDLEEMDLQWEISMLIIRVRRLMWFLRNQENKGRENNTRTITVETPTQNALIAQDGIRGYELEYQRLKKSNYKLCIDGILHLQEAPYSSDSE
ncbi:hypothetical protein Tco_1417249 [Tanacetum coccineum]